MERIVKPYLSQIIWLITAITSCALGLTALGFQFFNESVSDITLPISLMIGLAGLIGMIMLFIDQPDYCKLER